MKLYKVLISHTTVVLAESAEDAVEVARENSDRIMEEIALEPKAWDVIAKIDDPKQLPQGWHHHCFPWGDDGTKSVGYWLGRVANNRSQPGGEK